MALRDEIAEYERIRAELETEHNGRWVLICGGKLRGVFDDFQTVAEDAVKRFGRGPYLIRQVGAGPITLPASLMSLDELVAAGVVRPPLESPGSLTSVPGSVGSSSGR